MIDFNRLNALGNTEIGMSFIRLAFLESNFTQSWIRQMHKEGRGWYFGIDNYNDFFKQFGWKIKLTQPGEENANYGRWRYKVFPVSLNHIPRYFFIEAIKSINSDFGLIMVKPLEDLKHISQNLSSYELKFWLNLFCIEKYCVKIIISYHYLEE